MAYYYTLTLQEIIDDFEEGWFWVCCGDSLSAELECE